MPRLKALNDSWRRYPPLRVLAAAFVDYKPPAEKRQAARSGGDLGEGFFAVAKKIGK